MESHDIKQDWVQLWINNWSQIIWLDSKIIIGLGDFNRLDAYRLPDLQFNRKYLEYFSQSKNLLNRQKQIKNS